MNTNIFLIGFMGTGKTTVSRLLSGKLGYRELDMDREIERREGQKIKDIFASRGEAAFRAMETELLKELEQESNFVVSCGGGVPLRRENVESMKKSGLVVLLTAKVETVYERVCRGGNRPLLNGNMNVDYIAELMGKREQCYREAADFAVETDGRTPEKIAEEICGYL